MNESKKGPGEAEGDGRAQHGYRNEVTWEGGSGRQPYSNRGDREQPPDAMPDPEAGNAGETAGRNLEDLDAVKGKPGEGPRQSPRSTS